MAINYDINPEYTVMNEQISAIVLAGGKSTRFNTGRSKLIEKICGLEMVLYPIMILEKLALAPTILVGYQKEQVIAAIQQKIITPLTFIDQGEQKGTGHALACTKNTWNKDHILVLNGDIPLLTASTLEQFITTHCTTQATASFVVSSRYKNEYAQGYGRVIQENGRFHIIEYKELNQNNTDFPLNAGIYLFEKEFLLQYIDRLQANTKTQELYLTDLIGRASDANKHVVTFDVAFDEIRGVNTFAQLADAEKLKRAQLITHWMDEGVRFYNPESVIIDYNSSIGPRSTIGAGVHLLNGSNVGKECTLESFTILNNAHLADNVTIFAHTIISNSRIGQYSKIGPFAHVEEQCTLGQSNNIGNFVQVKRTNIEHNTKAKHLAFLGDAHIGSSTNIGAGTITCNYDSVHKHKTIIEDHCFIGSNSTLIAPLTIGSHSFIAAGSTTTNSIPPQSFAIGRTKQITKLEYAPILRKKLQAKKSAQSQDLYTEIPPTTAIKNNNNRNEL